jgi:hypothetical protein
MKRLSLALAAVFAVGAAPLALAQDQFVNEPVASVTANPNAPTTAIDAIANDLNAESSLKGSKITVQADNDIVYLTGAAKTEMQRIKASQIAVKHAGDGKVVNAIVGEEVVISVPDPQGRPQTRGERPADVPETQG